MAGVGGVKVASNKGNLCRNVAEDGVRRQAGVLGVGGGPSLIAGCMNLNRIVLSEPPFYHHHEVVNTYFTWEVRMK